MEKKKLKLSISSGSSKKTISSIEQAKTHSKNTVVIEKRSSRFSGKSQFSKTNVGKDKFRSSSSFSPKKMFFQSPFQHLRQILRREN